MKKSYDRIILTFEKLNTARIKNIGKMSKSDNEYILMAIDGSILEIPNSEELREQYGYQNSNKKESMTTNDEMLALRTDGRRLTRFTDERLKHKAEKLKKMPIRMVKIPLETRKIEYLITNLPFEDFTTEEMGKLYFKS